MGITPKHLLACNRTLRRKCVGDLKNFETWLKKWRKNSVFLNNVCLQPEQKLPYPGLAEALAKFLVTKVHFQTDSAMS